jgi:hypothetical protein
MNTFNYNGMYMILSNNSNTNLNYWDIDMGETNSSSGEIQFSKPFTDIPFVFITTQSDQIATAQIVSISKDKFQYKSFRF